MAERTLRVSIVGDADSLRRTLKGAGRDAKGFGRGLERAALPATAALGVLALGAKKATDAASDLSESQNAVNVVFGESADKIERFGKVAAREAGLSMKDLNE